MTREKILVLGASGMLGNAVLRYFAVCTDHDAIGLVRSRQSIGSLPEEVRHLIAVGGDFDDADVLLNAFDTHRPSIVINCVGIVKQLADANDPLTVIPINSLLPHRLARICSLVGARLVHMGTDCVFDGSRGLYTEDNVPDAGDLYGRSKLLGEVDYPHAVTLRTSIIGHELSGNRSLIDWFLSRNEPVGGYSNAIFSGMPTVEIARIIDHYVIPNRNLAGIFHLSADPIDKYSLLQLVSRIYGKTIEIREDPSLVINRSLDSTRFRAATGFRPDDWPTLVQRMHDFR